MKYDLDVQEFQDAFGRRYKGVLVTRANLERIPEEFYVRPVTESGEYIHPHNFEPYLVSGHNENDVAKAGDWIIRRLSDATMLFTDQATLSLTLMQVKVQ